MPKKIVRRPEGIVKADERFDNSKFYLQHGVDLEKRAISIYDEIHAETAAYVVRGLKKMVEVDPDALIDIEVGSYGGDAYYAAAIYDAITSCPGEVRTHAQGPVMSSGLTIYMAGDTRFAMPNVRFMAHTASSRTWGKEFEQEVDVVELKHINRQLCDIYEHSSNKSAAWWRRKLRTHDFYFGYDEALDLDIITNEYELEDE